MCVQTHVNFFNIRKVNTNIVILKKKERNFT